MTDDICNNTFHNDQQWHELYNWLLPLTQKWVWNANIPLWQGQQQDIAEEIVQETIVRTFRYHQSAEKNEVRPIVLLKPFSRTVARNYFQDLLRKDQRLTHMSRSLFSVINVKEDSSVDPSQIAVEHLTVQTFLATAAQIIPRLPRRQRQALLKDLASASYLDEELGVLARALAKNGIQLLDYYEHSSSDLAERKRNAALRYFAYKRLKKRDAESTCGDS